MLPTFPGPVLAVTADVVRHLEGEESLPILWTIFTKCKKSLKDGHRLENISWRLWYKSMAVPGSALCNVPSPDALAAEEVVLSEKAYRPPTPEELPLLPPITRDSTSNVPLSTQGITKQTHTLPLPEESIDSISLTVASSLSLSLSRMPSSRRNSDRKGSTRLRVGKILCELLPTATIPSLSSLTPVPNTASTLSALESSPPQSGEPRVSPSVTLPLSSPLSHFATNFPTMTTITKGDACPTISLPTPEVEQDQHNCSFIPVLPTHSDATNPPSTIPVITTNHPSPVDNSSEPLSDNRDQPAVLPPPPRLVVVNPTPNPTPHPTPPATPVLHLPVGHVQQEGGVVTASSVPLLRVPGQDALIQAQARAKCSQMSSKLRLLAHEVVDEVENKPSSGTVPAHNPISEASQPEEAPSAIPPPSSERPECALNPNRQSISSDTTSASSQQSSSFTPSEYSKTTTATTISEPFQYPQLGKRRSPSPHPAPTNSDIGLSPTSPSYDSESTQPLMPPAPKRRKEKDTASGSPAAGKVSGSSTSKGPGSVTSIKGPASSARLTNPTRKGSYGGGAITTGRNRIVREGSISSTKSRSRSRTRDGHSTALVPLAMTRATSGKGAGGKAARGRTGAMGRIRGKGLSKKRSLNEVVREGAEEMKRPMMFNFGSGSDEGSHPGSKSRRSGSELNVKQDGAPTSSNPSSHPQEIEKDVGGLSRSKDKVAIISQVMEEKGVGAQTGKEKEKGKGKGKEKVKSPMAKSSAVPTRVEATIADPLLPGSVPLQIVLTSDSEGFETETDIWSDTESVDAPVSASQQRLQAQQQQQQQQRRQQQQQQVQPRPSPLTRTQSDNIPRNLKPRTQQRLAEQRATEDRKLKDELFVKLPKSSFQDLAEVARTRSVGLLSQLLNPDPRRLPVDHPGRRGFSSGMIQPIRPFTPLAPVQRPNQHQPQQARTQPLVPAADPPQILPQPLPKAPPPQADQGAQPRQHSRQSSRTYQFPKRLAALTNSTIGVAAKTPVATAVMSELRVGSISGTKQVTTGGVSINGSAGKYKPKARPPETVMEDTSDSENDDNQLDLSKSVAQEKLKALLEGKKVKKLALSAVQANHDQDGVGTDGVYQFPSQPVEPISIPPPRLLYPYNLPPPNPPTTPRTTRRKMLTVEIPESLRRNLLWERQVSQAHPRGLKRRHSIGGVKGWHIPNVVKLTPKGVKPDESKDKKREENERRYLARTRSWAFEYHAVGW